MGTSSLSSLTYRDCKRNNRKKPTYRQLEEEIEGSLRCDEEGTTCEDSDQPLIALSYPEPCTPEMEQAQLRVRRELDIWYECLMCMPHSSNYECFLTDLWLEAKEKQE